MVKELLARADEPGSTPGNAVFRFFLPFYLLLLLLFLFLLFVLFSFILIATPADRALRSVYILSLSPEFYFGKRVSRALDLNTGQAYGQKKKT